ncbi:MAG TPA: thioredoxin-disulfide reductase [Acidimicrobiales bacterium]|nr:thioredoxin-disulfide reductase [Acidimicrobiales bacterium]
MPNQTHKLIIVGSGPAGLTAAIYAARASLEPLLLEGEPSSTTDQPGGALMTTTEVENFPGFPEGIMGPDLMLRFKEQAARFGTDVRMEKVSRIDLSARPFSLWVGDPEAAEPTYRAEAVVISTGARPVMLGLPGEQELVGHGVSTCATCDGFFFRDHDIAVVGGGDSALEEALFLTKFARSVTVVHRRDELRASKIMQERALAHDKVHFAWNRVVDGIEGDGTLSAITLRDVQTGALERRAVTGLFVAIGHRPNTDIFKGQVAMDDGGYVRTGPGTRTDVEGVFACGDVQDTVYRQAITAAGSGCMAAIDAERWLEAQH